MELSGLKTTVIGAGIGGLTAALAMRQRGAQVSVLEQAQAISEVGAGLQISPNGMAVMRALGLDDALKKRAVQAQAVELRDYAAGRLVSRLELSRLATDAPYYFIHRSDLIEVLAQAARDAGVKVLLLQKVTDIEPGKKSVVRLANGSEMKADLVIGADGLHSKMRGVLNGTVAPFFTRQVAWRTTVPNTIGHGAVAQVHMGPHRHVVSYPLRGGEMINVVAVQENMAWAEEGWHIADDPDNLRATFDDFGGDVREMLAQVQNVRRWGLFRHPLAPVWHKDGCALLGDAAHPTLPFMAQGAVMAMEDAWVLARCLHDAVDVNAGLASYHLARHERVRRVVDAASKNAWKYHLSNTPFRLAAHLGMRVASTFAPGPLMRQFDWIYRHDVTRD